MNRHRSEVDPIFQLMIARYAGASYLGVVLTGMGNDGAAGMLVMKKAGVFNLMQDEVSCLAVSMPKKAIIAGGADKANVEKKPPAAFPALAEAATRRQVAILPC